MENKEKKTLLIFVNEKAMLYHSAVVGIYVQTMVGN